MVNFRSTPRKLIFFALIVLCLASVPHSANATLVGYWKFDENAGDTALDSSGFGNTGAIQGATWVPGKYGSALSFDGIDDYVEVPNSSYFNSNAFTVSCWFKADDLTNVPSTLVARGEEPSTDHAHFSLGISKVKVAKISYEDNSDINYGSASSVEIGTDSWNFVAGVRDNSGNLKFYLNDGLESINTYSALPASIDQSVFIGGIFEAFSGARMAGFFSGTIDEVRFYNRGLSDDDIRALATHVSEPSTMLLIGTGLVGLVGLRRRLTS